MSQNYIIHICVSIQELLCPPKHTIKNYFWTEFVVLTHLVIWLPGLQMAFLKKRLIFPEIKHFWGVKTYRNLQKLHLYGISFQEKLWKVIWIFYFKKSLGILSKRLFRDSIWHCILHIRICIQNCSTMKPHKTQNYSEFEQSLFWTILIMKTVIKNRFYNFLN